MANGHSLEMLHHKMLSGTPKKYLKKSLQLFPNILVVTLDKRVSNIQLFFKYVWEHHLITE
jgi:hypothetical protein